MVSRRSGPVTGIRGLQRAARLAGESFGHEDAVGTSLTQAEGGSARWLWWAMAIAASAGLAALHFS